MKGVRAIKVDFQTKNARLEFDESVISAQKVALLMAGTPHMMGPDMRYGAWLLLRVTGLNDDATARKAEEVLSKVEGVAKVATYPKQQAVAVAFAPKGNLTTKDLIEAMAKGGLKASHY